MNSAELLHRQKDSQRAFYSALSSGSADARLVRMEGVQATVVPVREWFSIFNSAFYDHIDALDQAYDVLAEVYESAGVKAWTVWVAPDEDGGPGALEQHGHRLDSTPMLFAVAIKSLDLTAAMPLDLEPRPSWRLVAEINDRAHGVLEPWSMGAVFETMEDAASHLYVARWEGDPACALIARHHHDDCYFWFVATAPEARRRGLAAELMRHALREAREHGCMTASLESTKMAEPLYAQLGFQPIGRYQMWEKRSAASPSTGS